MCCLFGLIDYRRTLTVRQRNQIISALAASCEVRGTDATGIAYHSGGRLRIFKRPLPGHLMRFSIPRDAHVIMGHTRMATQGSARKNYNNHPFLGAVDTGTFALAHNGVLWNDHALRTRFGLPGTKIETDSYIGVQLIERAGTLGFASLRDMAEQLEGSFTITVLDPKDQLYIVKGDNPFCLYHFPAQGLYLYASTSAILMQALRKIRMQMGTPQEVHILCGELLRIGREGKITNASFDDRNLFVSPFRPFLTESLRNSPLRRSKPERTHLDELRCVAMAFGYAPEDVDRLAAQGFTPDELEELFYCGEL